MNFILRKRMGVSENKIEISMRINLENSAKSKSRVPVVF